MGPERDDCNQRCCAGNPMCFRLGCSSYREESSQLPYFCTAHCCVAMQVGLFSEPALGGLAAHLTSCWWSRFLSRGLLGTLFFESSSINCLVPLTSFVRCRKNRQQLLYLTICNIEFMTMQRMTFRSNGIIFVNEKGVALAQVIEFLWAGRLRKDLLLFGVFLFSVSVLSAQHFGWVTSGGYAEGNGSYNGSSDVAVDAEGNVYTYNNANAQQICQGNTYNPVVVSPTSYSMFIHKFNNAGELVWVKPIGEYMTPYAIEVDEAMNVYVLGYNQQTTFILDDVSSTVLQNQYYIVKLNAAGEFVWLHDTGVSNFGGLTNTSLLLYHQGLIYHQSSSLGVSCISSENGAFVGNITAESYIPTTAFPNIWFKSAAVFNNGDVLLVGEHRGRLDFGGIELPETQEAANKHRYFYLRCTPDLELVWYKSYGSFKQTFDLPLGVCIDNEDSIYSCVWVNFEETIVHPEGSYTNSTLVNGAGAFIKLNASGDLQWLQSIDAVGTVNPYGMVWKSDNSGLFACGVHPVTASFGTHTVVGSTSGKGFVVEISAAGEYIDAYATGEISVGALQSFSYALAKDGNGFYFVTGMLNTFNDWTASCQIQESNRGFFLMRFTGEDDAVPTPVITVDGITLTASPDFSGSIQWLLNGEEIEGANEGFYVAEETGDYSVVYTSEQGCTGTATSESVAVEVVNVPSQERSKILIYPNPSEGRLNIVPQTESRYSVQLFDASGRRVFLLESTSGSASLDLSSISAGYYHLSIETEQERVTERLIIR